tara:strand:+ start:2533 stop:3411 length:879 start_codon:yes stop_codon:yes gene_type:complete
MELFSRIPGDDSVISRIQTLDESKFGYPDFPDFHLAQFVLSNIECCEKLQQLEDQIYLLIWLACKVNQNDQRTTFDLVEHYAYLVKSDVLHLDLAQFLDELASTITEVIPSEQREKELNIFAFFLTNESVDERPFVPIMTEFRQNNKCITWLQDRYVAGVIYVSAIDTLRIYFKNSDRLFRRIVRGLKDTKLSEEDWFIMIRSVSKLLPEDSNIGAWHPVAAFKTSVYQPHSVSDVTLFVQMCTLFREDWMKIWTLMGWTKNRRTTRELLRFKTVSKVRPKYNTSTQLFCCM